MVVCCCWFAVLMLGVGSNQSGVVLCLGSYWISILLMTVLGMEFSKCSVAGDIDRIPVMIIV